MNYRVLTPELIAEARELRDTHHYSKRRIQRHLYEVYGLRVSDRTIYTSVYSPDTRVRNRTEYFREYFSRPRKACVPCPSCEKCMTRELDRTIPLNYQIEDRCITCYLRGIGLTFMDLLKQ